MTAAPPGRRRSADPNRGAAPMGLESVGDSAADAMADRREPDTNPHRNEAGSDAAVRRLGRSFMLAFYGAMRAIKLYPIENAAVIKALDELTSTTRVLIRQEHELEFRTSGEFIFIIRLDKQVTWFLIRGGNSTLC
jgi:hypothetical protein